MIAPFGARPAVERFVGNQIRLTIPILLIAFSAGCQHDLPPEDEHIFETCKPKLERESLQELHVTTRDGDQRDAFSQTLILTAGGREYRFPWGTIPLSRGPASLSKYQVYTFIISHDGTRLLSITEDGKVIYERP